MLVQDMKIYDISQRVFGCEVYPGDPAPEKQILCDMEKGDMYNLTAFSMCAHNGTHIDAPSHFINGGAGVEDIPLYKTVGFSYVAERDGDITPADAEEIIQKAKEINLESAKRILIKGNATVTDAAAEVFAKEEIYLLGNESQTVGTENAPMKTHLILLSKEVVLLEGIRLSDVSEGVYFLSAQPINLNGCEGAPCRAILAEV
jgi:arylformamidase